MIFVGAAPLGTSPALPSTFAFAATSEQQTRLTSADFQPFAGSIAFNSTLPYYVDQTPSNTTDDLPLLSSSNLVDFLTTAIHEIGHVLGIDPRADAFSNKLNPPPQLVPGDFETSSTGAKAQDLLIGLTAPMVLAGGVVAHLKGDGEGLVALTSSGYRSVMVPTINPGQRIAPQPLDIAILQDIGYEPVRFAVTGVPTWLPQGPAPINGADTQVALPPNFPVSGAIQTIAVDPTDSDGSTILSGHSEAVFGNRRTPRRPIQLDPPVWTPLTDQLPLMSVTALAFDLDNPSTLYMGVSTATSLMSGFGTRDAVQNDQWRDHLDRSCRPVLRRQTDRSNLRKGPDSSRRQRAWVAAKFRCGESVDGSELWDRTGIGHEPRDGSGKSEHHVCRHEERRGIPQYRYRPDLAQRE